MVRPTGKVYKIDKGKLAIGKVEKDSAGSSNHCQLTVANNLVYVEDISSKHGVYINFKSASDSKIPTNRPFLLKHNDKIKIGKTELTLIKQSDGPKESANTPKPPIQTNHILSGEPKCNPVLQAKVDDAKVHANNVIEILDSDVKEMSAKSQENPAPHKSPKETEKPSTSGLSTKKPNLAVKMTTKVTKVSSKAQANPTKAPQKRPRKDENPSTSGLPVIAPKKPKYEKAPAKIPVKPRGKTNAVVSE